MAKPDSKQSERSCLGMQSFFVNQEKEIIVFRGFSDGTVEKFDRSGTWTEIGEQNKIDDAADKKCIGFNAHILDEGQQYAAFRVFSDGTVQKMDRGSGWATLKE